MCKDGKERGRERERKPKKREKKGTFYDVPKQCKLTDFKVSERMQSSSERSQGGVKGWGK